MAVRFDASAEQYSRSASGMAGASFTAACWVQIVADRNTYSMFLCFDSAGTYWLLGTDVDGTTVRLWNASGDITTSMNLAVGTWYFVAGVFNTGGSEAVYSASATAAALSVVTGSQTGAANDSDTFRIGNDKDNEWLNGRIAAVKVWNAALTADELEAERFFYAPQRTNNLWAWYPFDAGIDTADYSGNGRTLTATGTLTSEDGPPILWNPKARYLIPVGGAPPPDDTIFLGTSAINAIELGTVAVTKVYQGTTEIWTP